MPHALIPTLSLVHASAGTLSAYSVFNPNYERLPGQLTAAQFENEIRGVPVENEPHRYMHEPARPDEPDMSDGDQEER